MFLTRRTILTLLTVVAVVVVLSVTAATQLPDIDRWIEMALAPSDSTR